MVASQRGGLSGGGGSRNYRTDALRGWGAPPPPTLYREAEGEFAKMFEVEPKRELVVSCYLRRENKKYPNYFDQRTGNAMSERAYAPGREISGCKTGHWAETG